MSTSGLDILISKVELGERLEEAEIANITLLMSYYRNYLTHEFARTTAFINSICDEESLEVLAQYSDNIHIRPEYIPGLNRLLDLSVVSQDLSS